jgi:hypothetical protein
MKSVRGMPMVTVEQCIRYHEAASEIERQRDKLVASITRILWASRHCSQFDWVGEDDPWGDAAALIEEIEASK